MLLIDSLPGGWFAFLRGIRLREDGKFDVDKTLEVTETADAKIAAASKEQHEAARTYPQPGSNAASHLAS